MHVGKAVQENDAVGDAVGVLHLLDGLLAPELGHLQETPVIEQAVMQPVLVDGGELVTQPLVEILDDFGVALHGALPKFRPRCAPMVDLQRF